MLSQKQEKLIKSLQTQKGREKSGFCLVEGAKNIKEADKYIEYTFTPEDSKDFKKLVTTKTPQSLAAVAKIPQWEQTDVEKYPTIVVLDGVQNPGNIGTIFRLCLGFNASLILIDSADPANSKAIRSSAGSFFHVPYLRLKRNNSLEILESFKRKTYKLELSKNQRNQIVFDPTKKLEEEIIIIAGSEGQGIILDIEGTSLNIPHDKKLESLNVTHSLAIILSGRY